MGTLLLLGHGGVAQNAGLRTLDLTGVLLAASSAAPLIAWRRFPLGVFVVAAAASAWMAGLGYLIDMTPSAATALFLFAASRKSPTRWRSLTVAAVGGMLVAYLGATAAGRGTIPGIELMHTGLAWAVAWFAGERIRLRRDQLANLSERAVRAERDAERDRRLAAAEERARIARDLHDAAGHTISVIAVRAGAARLRHAQDRIARSAPWRGSRSWHGRRSRRSTISSARCAMAAGRTGPSKPRPGWRRSTRWSRTTRLPGWR